LISASAAAACLSARSSVSVTTQSSFVPYFFSRARYIFVSSLKRSARANQFGELRNGGESEISTSLELRQLNLAEAKLRLWRVEFFFARVRMKRDRRLGVERHVDLPVRFVRSRLRLTPPSAIASCASVSSMPISFSAWCIISFVMRSGGVGDGLGEDGCGTGLRERVERQLVAATPAAPGPEAVLQSAASRFVFSSSF
jgi:hypothetical protein